MKLSSFFPDAQFHVKLFTSIFSFLLLAWFIFSIFSPSSYLNSPQDNVIFSKPDESVRFLNASQYPLSSIEKCDFLTGEWTPNPAGPTYTNETCGLIEGHQNCMTNGRPDRRYLYWKWKPEKCPLPPFDVDVFLKSMTNKSWAFIGDSISRNHVQSFLCVLSSKRDRAEETYHDEAYRSKRWHFRAHNVTVAAIWSPFLMKAAIHEDDNGVSTSDVELHLDRPDPGWADAYQGFDYVVISSGQWFLKYAVYYKGGRAVGCHSCTGPNVTSLGPDYAYRESLRCVLDTIGRSGHHGTVFFRTSTPSHFDDGEWWRGGKCTKTLPAGRGELRMNDMDRVLLQIELEEFGKAALVASRRGVDLRLLDFSRILLARPDGHPGPYRFPDPFHGGANRTAVNDCLHWCLPGPIDSINDLLFQMVLGGG